MVAVDAGAVVVAIAVAVTYTVTISVTTDASPRSPLLVVLDETAAALLTMLLILEVAALLLGMVGLSTVLLDCAAIVLDLTVLLLAPSFSGST